MGQRSVGLRNCIRRRRCRAGRVRVGHGRTGDCALTGETLQAEQSQEAVAELGRHQVVQDRVDSRIQVNHDAAEIDEHVEDFGTYAFGFLEQRQQPIGQQANKKADHHSAQHRHHLPEHKIQMHIKCLVVR